MLKRIGQFAFQMCKTWGGLLTTGFIIATIFSWQVTGHSISPRVGWAIIMGAIVIAAFQVWNRQVNLTEQLLRDKQPADDDVFVLGPPPEGFARLDKLDEPQPKLPIEVASIRSTFINRGDYCTFKESEHGFQAIVMAFKNQIATNPGEQNKSFSDVTANLTFKGPDKHEDIVYGTWLNQYTRSVQFKPGEVRHLVIAWFERGRKRLMGFYNPKSMNPLKGRWHSNIELHEPEQRVLPMSPCEVTVQLLSHDTTLFTERYILTATEDGTMDLKEHEATTVQPPSS